MFRTLSLVIGFVGRRGKPIIIDNFINSLAGMTPKPNTNQGIIQELIEKAIKLYTEEKNKNRDLYQKNEKNLDKIRELK